MTSWKKLCQQMGLVCFMLWQLTSVRREPRINERGVVVMAKKCHQACEAGEGEISSSCQKRDSNEHVSSDQSNICE